jgi:DNA-binding protein YbaB
MSEIPPFSQHDPVLPEPGQGPPPAIAPAALRGEGSAADGLIHVTVTYEGRIDRLHLDPEVLRLGPRRDAEALAGEIKHAVNAAIDHLHETIREDTGFGGMDVDLDQIAEDFQNTMKQLTQNIAEAHRRLDG